MNDLAICLNGAMSVQDNWLAHLKALVDAEAPGPKKRAGYRAVATAAGLDVEYVYQLYTGRRKTLGPDKVRAIARAYANGRDLSWIDQPIERKPDSPHRDKTFAAAIECIAKRMLQADAVTREAAAPLLSAVAHRPDESDRLGKILEALLDSGQQQAQSASQSWNGIDRRSRNLPVQVERRRGGRVIDENNPPNTRTRGGRLLG